MAEPPVSAEVETLEVGVTGGDLPFWRATEAVRYAQMKLSGQVQASQSLESRATSLTGWSVAALLALGAAVAGGTHELAAAVASSCLVAAALLCVWSILRRTFYTGYEPSILLDDQSSSEYEVVLSLAKGYQRAVEQNNAMLARSSRLVSAAMVLMIAAPFAGIAALLILPDSVAWRGRTGSGRAASALAVCRSAPGSSECAP